MSEAHTVRVRLAASLLLGLIFVCAACAEQIKPPLLQVGEIPPVKVNAQIADGEWDAATELGFLVGPHDRPADLGADLKVAWDQQGLAVLWKLPGDPEAVRRDRDGDILRDDAVELRLRAGEDAPVHRFAINSAGSIYDARGGDAGWDAVWRALALRGSDGWQVEMHIPFAAFNARAGDTVLANLIVNDADTNAPAAAWVAPAERGGGPFGFLRLGGTGSPVTLQDVEIEGDTATIFPEFAGEATLSATLFEDDVEVQMLETAGSGPLAVTLPRPGDFRLRLAGTAPDGELVLQRELSLKRIPPIVLTAHKRLLADREIDLTIDGAGLSVAPDSYLVAATDVQPVEVPADADRTAAATVDLTPCAAGELTVAVAAVADGEQIATETLSFVLPPRPDWAGSSLGKHGRLMEPWVPVEVRGTRLRCWDRVYDFRDRLLPVSLRSGGQELLAAPVTLRVAAGGVKRAWEEATVRRTETTGTHAEAIRIAQSPLVEARVRTNLWYDGLMTFDLRINPRGEQPLSEVQLEIPVTSEFATHLQIADGTQEGFLAGAVGHERRVRGFAPIVSLTGRTRGVQWLCQSDAGWALEEPESAVAIAPGRGRTTLTVRMLDHELLPGEAFETTFALQVTPVRPVPEGWHDWRTATLLELPIVDGECDAAVVAALSERHVRTVVLDDQQFRPRPGGLGGAADAALSEFARLCHEAGMRLMLVIDDDLTRDPIWEAYRDEVASAGGATDGETLRPCPGGAWADYVVEAADYALREYNADGIHLRAGSFVGQWSPDEDRDGGVMGAREMMMRLRTVVHRSGPGATLTAELSGGTPAAAVGFADGLVVRSTDDEGNVIADEQFAAEGGVGALGTAVEVALPEEVRSATVYRALGLGLLHDAGLRPIAPSAGFAGANMAWQAQAQFNVEAANWRPWWSERPLVTASSPKVLVSSWWREGEALAVVTNLSDDEPVVELSLDRETLDLGPWLWAVDTLTGRRVPQIGEVLRTRMDPGQMSLIHVRTRFEREVEIDE